MMLKRFVHPMHCLGLSRTAAPLDSVLAKLALFRKVERFGRLKSKTTLRSRFFDQATLQELASVRKLLSILRLPRHTSARYVIRMTPEQRLATLHVALPPAPKPVALYKPVVVVDKIAYVSGHGPLKVDKTLITGVVGRDLDLAAGHAAARQVGLAMLATLREQFGNLDAVRRVVKVLGMVNSAPDFYDHPKVINGCSELFAEVWGVEDGVGARSAVGMGPLPGNIAVEIEAIFELK
jgi:enamine deaminase RidA (YjgF/YER057c/UK114 family)